MAKTDTKTHPGFENMAGFLSKSLPGNEMRRIESHISSCEACLEEAVSAYDAVREFNSNVRRKKERTGIMKKVNLYLFLAAAAFCLSFMAKRYFIQLLVAAVIFGMKWVADSKSARMLVMIYEAWKTGGEREASRILQNLDTFDKKRL